MCTTKDYQQWFLKKYFKSTCVNDIIIKCTFWPFLSLILNYLQVLFSVHSISQGLLQEFFFFFFAMQFIWSFISLINVQTSVAADIFLKLPAWEDMTAENKTQRCCKTCLASGTTVCAGKTAQANISWYSKFISSVLRITQSIWQLAHTDKWGKSPDIHKQWHRKSLFRVSCQIM